jgi:signal transduction histidine kinase
VTRRRWAFDAALAAAVLALGQLEVWTGINATHRQGPHWAQALEYGITALLLVFRRLSPLGCLLAIVAVSVIGDAIVGSPEGLGAMLPALVAAYTVGRHEPWPRSAWGLVLVTTLWAGWATLDPTNTAGQDKLLTVIWLAPWVIAWLLGALVRSSASLTEQRRLAREQRASRAVAEERNRIARELHDVIGHSVSVMTVQAAAVRRRLAPDQATERQALETVEAVGREALTEMRRMVGVLRQEGDRADREPPPGMDQLERLADQFRAAGLPVTLVVTGTPRPLAPGLDLTAYRLVQEGLTNTLRHASTPQSAEVSINYADDALELAVRDDGATLAAPAEAGHGLLGLKERVSVYGGRLVAQPRADGGFELVATLPFEHAATVGTT